jgi:hypothetical protein
MKAFGPYRDMHAVEARAPKLPRLAAQIGTLRAVRTGLAEFVIERLETKEVTDSLGLASKSETWNLVRVVRDALTENEVRYPSLLDRQGAEMGVFMFPFLVAMDEERNGPLPPEVQ